ncbi:MAG: 2-oxoacid:acceptor oxidoreductase subunit alpha [Proteobacteria bacterium]|nr:2-oxoacid:acceptor oxidoreductase subunit alpha [Pseudomonadota bacterium]MBU1711284.1 2-oxoacid:acceptor oxidoreductase subunit alpha [Pseudomonadota bacterium]
MTGQASNDISIVLGGEAGQGIQTIEQLLTKILKLDGYQVYATKEYMSRVRGGTNTTSIRVASRQVRTPVRRIDLLFPLDKNVIPHLQSRISDQTVIIGDGSVLGTDMQLVDIPFNAMAKELGNEMYANTLALGMLLGLLQTDQQVTEKYLHNRFTDKGEEVVAKNIEAARQGYGKGLELLQSGAVSVAPIERSDISNEIMVNGSEAIAMGAIAGGCQCITSYPMTPGTGVITFMAGHMHDFDLLVEQAEDEIAAINMALGAWYAGARAMVTTSGGGFALMTEGISLAGMMESPVVIHLAQRPGPATGLPTRTEQGDLELALYAGHGEFPRIILAPESLDTAFHLTQKAFNMADKYQVPVFVLSDQYLVDTYYNTAAFNLNGLKIEQQVVETKEDYQRYRLTEDGISPRGIPGGIGLVGADSDEHDEAGHITEDLQLRPKMVDKRLKKLEKIKTDTIPSPLFGPQDYKILVLSWGSTNLIVKEALGSLARKNIAALTFTQVYPLPDDLSSQLERADQTIIIENNATSQLGNLILRETGHRIDQAILKYNGLPFTVEELIEEIGKCLPREETR